MVKLSLKPNSIGPTTLHHLANNILLSFQFYTHSLSLSLWGSQLFLDGDLGFWAFLVVTHKGKRFLLGLFGALLGSLWVFLMWVFWIWFIYKVFVCGFASKLGFLLWFCGCVLFLHDVIFKTIRFCYVGIWILISLWGTCKWVPFTNFKIGFVRLIWFWGFEISSDFYCIDYSLKLWSFYDWVLCHWSGLLDFCSIHWILDSLSQVYMQIRFC